MSLIGESRVDVLIIGAGPAGLMCANGLAKAGVNVRVVDQRCGEHFFSHCVNEALTMYTQRPTKVAAGQADGIQPRTIEVLQVRGTPSCAKTPQAL